MAAHFFRVNHPFDLVSLVGDQNVVDPARHKQQLLRLVGVHHHHRQERSHGAGLFHHAPNAIRDRDRPDENLQQVARPRVEQLRAHTIQVDFALP